MLLHPGSCGIEYFVQYISAPMYPAAEPHAVGPGLLGRVQQPRHAVVCDAHPRTRAAADQCPAVPPASDGSPPCCPGSTQLYRRTYPGNDDASISRITSADLSEALAA